MAQMAGESRYNEVAYSHIILSLTSLVETGTEELIPLPLSREPEFFGLSTFIHANYGALQGNIFIVG